MVEPLRVDLFVEDAGHEAFIGALVRRIAREETREVEVVSRSARGGHGKALSEFRVYQRRCRVAGRPPDVLVVATDANCRGLTEAISKVREAIDEALFPSVALAVPDPHVERWYMADPQALLAALDARVAPGRRKCQRDLYKRMLREALLRAGHPVTLGGEEFAEEIVEAMDLYRATKNESTKNEPSLAIFLDDLRGSLRRLP